MKKPFLMLVALLLGFSVKAQMDSVPIGILGGPDLPDSPYRVDYMAGRQATFTVTKGSGVLKSSGSYVIKFTTNQLIFVKGTSTTKTVFDGFDLDFQLFYTNLPSMRVGDYMFKMTAPFSGNFSNVLFATSNAPPVIAGEQAGTFVMTDKRIDMSQDTNPDIIWQRDDGHLGVWFMTNAINGTILDTNLNKGIYFDSLYTATTNSLDPNWRIVGQKDLNFDGMLDWVWQNTNSGAVRVWLLTPTNFVATALTNFNYSLYYDTNLQQNVFVQEAIPSALQPDDNTYRLVGMSDLDADGAPDFIFQTGTGDLFYQSYWETFDQALSNPARALPSRANSTLVGVVDLNDDGWPDLLWQSNINPKGQAILVPLKSVNGSLIAKSPIALNGGAAMPSWKICGNADFNHDGQMDLLLRNTATGQLIFWYMRGTAIMKTSTIGGPIVPWQIVGPK